MDPTRLEAVFRGVTPRPFRLYLRKAFEQTRKNYPNLVVPAAGRFTAVDLAVQAGYDPKNVVTSDISLFTSALGYLITGRPMTELGIELLAPELTAKNDELAGDRGFGVVMWAMKWAQLKAKHHHEASYRRELLYNAETYIGQMQATGDRYAHRLGGLSYRIEDMWDAIKTWCGEGSALIFINPPGYKDGYGKMFNMRGALTWDAPEIPEFDPTVDHQRMYAEVMDHPALSIMYRYQEIEPELESHAVYSLEFTKDRRDYLLCNRAEELPRGVKPRTRTKVRASKHPLMPWDFEITTKSRIQFITATKEESLYYRDLFAHKLGVVRSEQYFLALIDGYVWATFGCMFHRLMIGRSDHVHESFGFNIASQYKRLNRLFMMCLVSGDSQTMFHRTFPGFEGEIPALETTCLCPYPELKINRGILKLMKREELDAHTYRLIYRAEFNDESFKDCIGRWLQKHGKVIQDREGRIIEQ